MPRNISYALTTPQILAETKDVTRRDGWENLKPGELLWAVDKTMGFKKGEKPARLKLIRVKTLRREPLTAITPEECVREGFPGMTPAEFIAMYCAKNKRDPDKPVTRIEFGYMWLEPSFPIRVPAKLAVCPICGGRLDITDCTAWEEAESGLMKPTEITTECEHEPDIESDEWLEWNAFHYATPYIDWLPVDTRVLSWFQTKSRWLTPEHKH